MAKSNTTLASLWDDGQSSPMKIIHTTPVKMEQGGELQHEIVQFYKTSGLESMAKEHGIMDANGELSGLSGPSSNRTGMQTAMIVTVPMSPHKSSPYRATEYAPRVIHTQSVLTTQQQQQYMPGSPHMITAASSPHTPVYQNRKRQSDILIEHEYSEGKRSKKGEKGGKGLRHFSMKVCEKVQKKGVTSYNEVADELVAEFSDPRNIMSPQDAG